MLAWLCGLGGCGEFIATVPGALHFSRRDQSGLVRALAFYACKQTCTVGELPHPFDRRLVVASRYLSIERAPVPAAIRVLIQEMAALTAIARHRVGDSPVRDSSGIPFLVRRTLRTGDLDGLQFMAGNIGE